MISLSRNKWEAYVGLPQKQVLKVLEGELEKKQYAYSITKSPPNYMYDSLHDQIIIRTNDIELSLIYVSNDPLTRMFTAILGTKRQTNGITLLSVKYTKYSINHTKKLLKGFSQHSPVEPWKIRSHPRFQFAILLELLTRLKWKSFTLI